MDEKSKPIIVALKTKEGDVLGFYLGESEETETTERGMILYRPVFIEPSTRFFNGKPIYSYDTTSYFEFGSQKVTIPYSRILHHDVASDFFTVFFLENIGEIIAKQDMVNEGYLKYYENRMMKEAMQDTDSVYVHTDVEFMQ